MNTCANETTSSVGRGTGELNPYYTALEVVVAIVAVIGNAMVIMVFRKERRLRRRTNYYIVSLAVADLLVGLLGIPFAIMASVGLPKQLYLCLFTVSLLIVLCTISIFCLVAVSVDRYWAILHPMGYSRNVRTKTAIVIISICWVAGSIVGFLPLMGWYKDCDYATTQQCYFLSVMDYNYLVFLFFATIIFPAIVLAVFYAHIYDVILRQLRQTLVVNPGRGRRSGGGTMLRMLGAAQKREVKATQNLSIIVLFFMICWIPLYTINCIIAFRQETKVDENVMYCCIILSHLNSAINPILYAYHLKDFRAALKAFICNLVGSDSQPIQPFGTNNNFSHYRLQSLRETRDSVSLSKNRLISESQAGLMRARMQNTPKVSTLVSNSVAITAATADTNRDIWRISEISDEGGNRNANYNDEYDDDDDDVFLQERPPSQNENIPVLKVKKLNNLSTSSPQLSRNLFLVEAELRDINSAVKTKRSSSMDKHEVTSGDFIHSPAKSLKLSPFKTVGELWKFNKPPRSCSLSEDTDSARHRNGYVSENHSSGY